jgi:hypothetical protein
MHLTLDLFVILSAILLLHAVLHLYRIRAHERSTKLGVTEPWPGKYRGAAKKRPPRANHEGVRFARRLCIGRLYFVNNPIPKPAPPVMDSGRLLACARGRRLSCRHDRGFFIRADAGLSYTVGDPSSLTHSSIGNLGITTVDKQHGNDDGAVDDLSACFGICMIDSTELRRTIRMQRAEITPPAAQDIRASDDNRGESPAADKHCPFLIGFGGIASEHDTGESRREPAQREGEDDNAARSGAGEMRCSFALADEILNRAPLPKVVCVRKTETTRETAAQISRATGTLAMRSALMNRIRSVAAVCGAKHRYGRP